MEYIWMFYMIDIFVSVIRNIQLLGGQYINYFIAFSLTFDHSSLC